MTRAEGQRAQTPYRGRYHGPVAVRAGHRGRHLGSGRGQTPLTVLARLCQRLGRVRAGGGYAGKLVIWAKEALNLTLTIVKRSDDTTGFHVPHSWVIERTLPWTAPATAPASATTNG